MTHIILNFKTQMILWVQPAVIWGNCAYCLPHGAFTCFI